MPRSRESKEPPNREFGAFVEQAAIEAGYEMRHGGSGRSRLAEDAGMSVWAIARILQGESLPKPENFQHLAAATGRPTRDFLIAAKVLPKDDTPAITNSPNGAIPVVRSVTAPVTPETACDLLDVTHPMVRQMLIGSINQALRVQRGFNEGGTTGESAASGR